MQKISEIMAWSVRAKYSPLTLSVLVVFVLVLTSLFYVRNKPLQTGSRASTSLTLQLPVAGRAMGVGAMRHGGDDKTVKAYFIDAAAACRSGQGEGLVSRPRSHWGRHFCVCQWSCSVHMRMYFLRRKRFPFWRRFQTSSVNVLSSVSFSVPSQWEPVRCLWHIWFYNQPNLRPVFKRSSQPSLLLPKSVWKCAEGRFWVFSEPGAATKSLFMISLKMLVFSRGISAWKCGASVCAVVLV